MLDVIVKLWPRQVRTTEAPSRGCNQKRGDDCSQLWRGVRGRGDGRGQISGLEREGLQADTVAVVPGQEEQPGLSSAVPFESTGQFGDGVARAPRDRLKNVFRGRQASLNSDAGRVGRAGHHAADAGNHPAGGSLMAMMQVEVPTTLTTSPSRTPAPMASQCASNAPTGMGMPARNRSLAAHSAESRPAI